MVLGLDGRDEADEISSVVRTSTVVSKAVLGVVGWDEDVWVTLVVLTSFVAVETVRGLVFRDEAVGISLVRASFVIANAVLEFVGEVELVGIPLVIRTSTVVAEPEL